MVEDLTLVPMFALIQPPIQRQSAASGSRPSDALSGPADVTPI